jgi:hypothetical protein
MLPRLNLAGENVVKKPERRLAALARPRGVVDSMRMRRVGLLGQTGGRAVGVCVNG